MKQLMSPCDYVLEYPEQQLIIPKKDDCIKMKIYISKDLPINVDFIKSTLLNLNIKPTYVDKSDEMLTNTGISILYD